MTIRARFHQPVVPPLCRTRSGASDMHPRFWLSRMPDRPGLTRSGWACVLGRSRLCSSSTYSDKSRLKWSSMKSAYTKKDCWSSITAQPRSSVPTERGCSIFDFSMDSKNKPEPDRSWETLSTPGEPVEPSTASAMRSRTLSIPRRSTREPATRKSSTVSFRLSCARDST